MNGNQVVSRNAILQATNTRRPPLQTRRRYLLKTFRLIRVLLCADTQRGLQTCFGSTGKSAGLVLVAASSYEWNTNFEIIEFQPFLFSFFLPTFERASERAGRILFTESRESPLLNEFINWKEALEWYFFFLFFCWWMSEDLITFTLSVWKVIFNLIEWNRWKYSWNNIDC